MIENIVNEYARYRSIGEEAIRQVADADLNRVLRADINSIAMIVRHIHGNLLSRFTDFLVADGEKPWRDRDAEFEERSYSRQEVEQMWAQGFEVLGSEVSKLSDEHLLESVYIRGVAWTVHGALCRSLAHVSYHVGQIVFLARVLKEGEWQWISIPKGASRKYNENPTREKLPG